MDAAQIWTALRSGLAALASTSFYLNLAKTAGLILLVLAFFKAAQAIVWRLLKGRVAEQNLQLLRKGFRYAGYVVAAMTVLNLLGVDLTALIGAAGIAGIAVGFAAQTSVSNVISGVFLISEKPFAVGDVIQVGDVMGTVLSIDFLSIKIQTFDNRFVRIPNETIIKTNVVNVTRYPIRRLDIWVSVSYGDDLERAVAILKDIARENVYALDNPEPLIIIDKFDASGINILFGPWFEKSDYLSLKNSAMIEIKKRFEAEGLTIPFPQLDVRIGDIPAAPFPVPDRKRG